MKRFFIFWPIILATCSLVNAQGGTWVWMNGNNVYNSTGEYGTQGVPSSENCPQGVYAAAQWTDKEGNFWVFGGVPSYTGILAGDLWRFDPATNMWTWMNGPGSDDIDAWWGNLGVPSSLTYPGAHGYESATWTDTSGRLWLYGGYEDTQNSYQVSDNLWVYDIGTNQWTWMGGNYICSDTATYGLLGVPDTGNSPGARYELNTTWVDKNNNLWLFGGLSTSDSAYSDMWMYNIALGKWAWMAGPQGVGPAGQYGVLGVEAPGNLPPARACYTHWADNAGNLYIWGGNDFVENVYNDLWKFDINTYEWVWLSGPDTSNSPGNNGQLCTEDSSNQPRARYENRTTEISGCPNSLFTFGGFRTNGPEPDTDFNDLWLFDLTAKEWKWISGSEVSNSAGNYGTKGIASLQNMPPARGGACLWTDKQNNLWLFGGMLDNDNGDKFNDTWEFFPDSNCVPLNLTLAHLSFTLSAQAVCPGDSAELTLLADSGLAVSPLTGVYWIDSSHAIIKPDSTTSYHLSGYNACGTYIDSVFLLQVINNGFQISANKDTLCPGDTAQICAPSGFTGYHWNTGDTGSCINTSNAGNYSVTVSENGNCSATSNAITISVYQQTPVTVSISGDTLTGSGGTTYQWLLNGIPITGANSSVYIAAASGTYTLQITDNNGCTATSTPVVISGITSVLSDNSIKIFPNPSTGNWQLSVTSELIGSIAEVYDATGRMVFKSEIRNPQSEIALPNSASGVYELRIVSNDFSIVRKLVRIQ